jgi:TPR repeat protein
MLMQHSPVLLQKTVIMVLFLTTQPPFSSRSDTPSDIGNARIKEIKHLAEGWSPSSALVLRPGAHIMSANQGIAPAQLHYGILLANGNEARLRYGIVPDREAGFTMNKSCSGLYYEMSVDQGNAFAQLNDGVLLATRDDIGMDRSFGFLISKGQMIKD